MLIVHLVATSQLVSGEHGLFGAQMSGVIRTCFKDDTQRYRGSLTCHKISRWQLTDKELLPLYRKWLKLKSYIPK